MPNPFILRDNQELLVNLYIPSRLHWKEKRFEADFGYLFPGIGYGYSKDG